MSESKDLRTDRTRIRRVPDRGHYDRPTIDAILDAHFLCHLAFASEGQAHIVPMLYARDGDHVLVHGATKSRLIQSLAAGTPFSLAVTLLDGLVIARSAFHSSANYRSVVLYGTATAVEDEAEKIAALEKLTSHMIPGRWAEVRPLKPNELKATTVLALPITEGAAKIRNGPPKDDAEDYESDTWAGVVPIRMQAGEPEADPKLKAGIEMPESVGKLLKKDYFKAP